jgi:hypothetical protein
MVFKTLTENKITSSQFLDKDIRVSVKEMSPENMMLERFLHQWYVPVGVLMAASCDTTQQILFEVMKVISNLWIFRTDFYILTLYPQRDSRGVSDNPSSR